MNSGIRHAAILVIGHACLDSVALCEGAPPEDGKLEASRIWTGPGGPAANAALALSRLGHEVRLWTRIGDDPAGSIVRDGLRSAGVELVDDLVPDATTSLAQIRAVGGARSVVWRRGRLPVLPADEPVLRDLLEGVEMVYVDGHEVAASSAALRLAREQGAWTVADLGSLREGAADWPRWLDCAVAAPRWLQARFPAAPDMESALAELVAASGERAIVGLTLGERGGFARRGADRLSWAARKTGVVDTTVAGDAFHAGLADAMIQSMDPQAALDWAATLAAAVCRAPGHLALPRDRSELQLWHGRWGYRQTPDEAWLGGSLPAQGTATK